MTPLPPLPTSRGPLSDRLIDSLAREPGHAGGLSDGTDVADPWGDDVQLTLYVAFELRYRGFAGVDPAWELDPDVLALTRALGDAFLSTVGEEVGPVEVSTPVEVRDALVALASGDGPSLSRWIDEQGTLDHLREFAVHRSAYQLKEADPHSFALPRLPAGRAKAAFVEIQADEYGGGVPGASHQELFAGTLRALGLDDQYGAHVDLVPAPTLATVNLVSAFGERRALLGALRRPPGAVRDDVGRPDGPLRPCGPPAGGQRRRRPLLRRARACRPAPPATGARPDGGAVRRGRPRARPDRGVRRPGIGRGRGPLHLAPARVLAARGVVAAPPARPGRRRRGRRDRRPRRASAGQGASRPRVSSDGGSALRCGACRRRAPSAPCRRRSRGRRRGAGDQPRPPRHAPPHLRRRHPPAGCPARCPADRVATSPPPRPTTHERLPNDGHIATQRACGGSRIPRPSASPTGTLWAVAYRGNKLRKRS